MDKLFKIPILEDFKRVTDEIICSLYNAENKQTNILKEEDVKLAKTDIKQCIIETSFDTDRLTVLLESQEYSENKVLYFISTLKERRTELLLSTLIYFNSAYGETIQDFDWLLKLIIGTSELKTIKYPLLQLVLLTVTKTGNNDEKVYDISKVMLDKMIVLLEDTLKT